MMTDPAASRPGTHLDPDRLADLVEGLLDPAAADVARTHLASCRLCSADFALIAGEDPGDLYGAGLGELLPPMPIPQDVVVRIEAALHREPPLGTGTGTAQPSAAPAAARPRRRRLRLALGSLAGATLVVAGGIGTLVATNSGSTSGSASSSAGRAPDAQPGDTSHAGQAPNRESPAVGAPGSASTPAPFSDLSIEKQAQALLGQHGASPATGPAEATKPQCSPSTVPTGTKPLAVTRIEYQGKQAWLLVYAEPGTTTVADVYVVDVDSCTSGTTGQFAYQTTVTRP